ncbi:hypothetical protein X777_05050 [Ooceraea biroi]|uniref:Uncharacterized protein n=1 Tax=Ooceraea biroi TaxID=2015173 RepID=A0A026WF67_OOCBI|nr:hypothetical protein X777_05050 [Ooceraea biroi]
MHFHRDASSSDAASREFCRNVAEDIFNGLLLMNRQSHRCIAAEVVPKFLREIRENSL